MLDVFGPKRKCRSTLSRREVLRLGGLGFAGLSLTDILRRQGKAESGSGRGKSVIMIWMRGGPSHIDSFDMKPEAPAEVRGEFNPIATNVPGIDICEYMPLLAGCMDKLAIVRGIKSNDIGDHTPHYIITGSPERGRHPAFGSTVSYLQQRHDGLPSYVSLNYEPPGLYDYESPLYLGPSHRPFAPRDEGLENLSLARGVTLERLNSRKQLIREFDRFHREFDQIKSMSGIDEFTREAMQIVASPRARDAFDVSQETPEAYARYGKFCENFLIARRLVEAGVSVVTLKVGDWDTHEKNFIDMRTQLPQLDRGFHALVTDLYERGLEQDVAVVLWGEFGRAPRISRGDGRDHWPEAGAAVLAGGGFRTGQTIGQTDAHGARALGRPYTPGNIQTNLYRHLGIDPSLTIPDYNQRPRYILDERDPVQELSG